MRNVFPLILLTLFCLFAQFIYGENIEVVPAYIMFDCKGGYDSDALTTADNQGNQIQLPEWESPQTIYKPAYISKQKDRTISVCFKTLNENYLNTDMHLIINLTVTDNNGIGTVCNFFIDNYSANSFREIKLNGTLPEKVGIYTFHWRWKIYAIPINQPNLCSALSDITTEHSYYILSALPKQPMGIPWTGVLEKACSWASGQIESNGIAEKVVEGLYNETGFKYNVASGGPRYTGAYGSSFNLTNMLSEIGGSNIIVNCFDMGKAVTIFANALGCNSSYNYCYHFGYVNCIKPIGRDWTNNPIYEYGYTYSSKLIVGEDDSEYTTPYGRTYFTQHAFCILGGKIYDACLKVNTSDNPDAPPFIESWVNNLDWSEYKNAIIDYSPSPPYGTSEPSPYSFIVY